MYKISLSTLSNYVEEKQSCSANFIHKIVKETGLKFEKAFELK